MGPTDIGFAGRTTEDTVALHAPGTDRTWVVGFGEDTALEDAPLEVALGADARSVWYTPDGGVVLVAADGTLSVDGVQVAGSFRWARR